MIGTVIKRRHCQKASGILVLGSLLTTLAWAAFNFLLVLNASWSAPHWGFVRLPGALYLSDPNIDDWVMFTPPVGAHWLYIKQVKGVEGDLVSVGPERLVMINGIPVGHAKTHSLSGRPVDPIREGVIPAGHVFVVAPHRDSHDSRYAEIGLIPLTAIQALVWPLPDIPSLGLVGSLLTTPASAADLGVHGQIWSVTEANLLDRIAEELGRAEADGRLAAFNSRLKDQATSAFTNRPALPLHRVTKPASRLFDPSITVRRDIRDHRGQLIVTAGTTVNPLDRLPMGATLVFIDGRDPDQIAFALAHPRPVKIILTGGNPLKLMKAHDRRLFYDQKGVLTAKFGLTAVPSVITQAGNRLLISEIPVSDVRAGKEAQP